MSHEVDDVCFGLGSSAPLGSCVNSMLESTILGDISVGEI
jgi:hypothetical protein